MRAIIVPGVTNSRSFGLSIPLPSGFVGERLDFGWAASKVSERDALAAAGLFDPAKAGAAGEPTTLGGRGSLRRIVLPSGPVLVRQYLHGGLFRSVTGSCFCDAGRPFRELALAAELRAAGIATPEPLAAAALGRWPAYRLFFVSREIEGKDLDAALRAESDPARRGALLASAGNAARKFHDAGFFHADFHPKNFLVGSRTGEIHVLDLDRGRRFSSLSRGQRAANLARLYRYGLRREALGEGLAWSGEDFLRLLRGYDVGGADALWEEIQAEISQASLLHRLGWAVEKRRNS